MNTLRKYVLFAFATTALSVTLASVTAMAYCPEVDDQVRDVEAPVAIRKERDGVRRWRFEDAQSHAAIGEPAGAILASAKPRGT